MLKQAGISLLAASLTHRTSDYRALVDEVRAGCPDLRAVHYIGDASWDELLSTAPEVTGDQLAAREAELSCDDPINIQYTSGTTGFPKGATLSHHNILNNGYFVGGELVAYTEQDRVCLPVPFYHCFGMVMGNLGITSHGACIVIPCPLVRTRGRAERRAAGALHLAVRGAHDVHRRAEPAGLRVVRPLLAAHRSWPGRRVRSR